MPEDTNINYGTPLQGGDYQLVANQETGNFNEATDYVCVVLYNASNVLAEFDTSGVRGPAVFYASLSPAPFSIHTPTREVDTTLSSIEMSLKTIGLGNDAGGVPYNDFTIYKNDNDGSLYIKPNEILTQYGMEPGNYNLDVNFLSQVNNFPKDFSYFDAPTHFPQGLNFNDEVTQEQYGSMFNELPFPAWSDELNSLVDGDLQINTLDANEFINNNNRPDIAQYISEINAESGGSDFVNFGLPVFSDTYGGLGSADSTAHYHFIVKQVSTSRKEIRLKLYDENINSSSEILKRLERELNYNQEKYTTTGELNPDYRYQFKHGIFIPGQDYIPITNYHIDKITEGPDNQSIILRLYRPFPITIPINSPISLERLVLDVQRTSLHYFPDIEEIQDGTGLENPEVSGINDTENWLNVEENEIGLTPQNYNALTESISDVIVSGILSESIYDYPNLNTDFNEFKNHTFFGSAKKKLENFETKVKNIQNHYTDISSSLHAQGVSILGDSNDLISYRENLFNKINNIINGFTPYEKFLYFDGQSETTSSAPGLKNYAHDYAMKSTTGFGSTFYNTNTKSTKFDTKNGLPMVYQVTQSVNHISNTEYFRGSTGPIDTEYRAEQKPFFNYSSSVYLSFLVKGDSTFHRVTESYGSGRVAGEVAGNSNPTTLNHRYLGWGYNAGGGHYRQPEDSIYKRTIMSASFTGSEYRRYIFETSASYWVPLQGDGINMMPTTNPDAADVTKWDAGSNQIMILSGSIKSSSWGIKTSGPYQALSTVQTQSGVPHTGAILPSGDLFAIRSFAPFIRHISGSWSVDTQTSGSLVTDDMLIDFSNQENTGSVSGSVKVSDGLQHAGNTYGKSFYFVSESSDQVRFYSDENFNFTQNDNFSLSIWVKRFHPNTGSADATADNVQGIFSRGIPNHADTGVYGIDYNMVDNTIRAGVRKSNKDGRGTQAELVTHDFGLEDMTGSFHHIVFTYESGSGRGINLYVNGQLSAFTSTTGSAFSVTGSSTISSSVDLISNPRFVLSLGGSGHSSNIAGSPQNFNGYLQYPRVYAKTLTQQEVSRLYENPDGILDADIVDIKVSLTDPSDILPFDNVYHTSSANWTNWYNGLYESASAFDIDNIHSFENNLPTYIRESNEYDDLKDFLNLQGEQYDVIRNHIDSLGTLYNRGYKKTDSPPENAYPILLHNIGYEAINMFSGSLSDSLGSYLTSVTTIDDIKNNTWRKLLNNLLYVYKSKGTINSVRGLLNIHGYPPDVLKIQEYGGSTQNQVDPGPTESDPTFIAPQGGGGEKPISDKLPKNIDEVPETYSDTDLGQRKGDTTFVNDKQKLYNYRFSENTERNLYLDWYKNDANINSIEFNYKHAFTENEETLLISSGSGDEVLWDLRLVPSTKNSDGIISSSLEFRLNYSYTGSAIITASAVSMSTPYIKMLEGQTWNVLLQRVSSSVSGSGTNEYRLHTTLQDGPAITKYGYVTMSVSGGLLLDETTYVTGGADSNYYANQNWVLTGSRAHTHAGNLSLGNGITGSFSEIKAWTTCLSRSRFRQHTLNKFSTVGNSVSSYNKELVYHFKLNENYSSASISSSTQTLPIIDSAPKTTLTTDYTFDISSSLYTSSVMYGYDIIDKVTLGFSDNSQNRRNDNSIFINPRRNFISDLNPNKSAVTKINSTNKQSVIKSTRLDINISPQDIINDHILNNMDATNLELYYGNPSDLYSSSYGLLDTIRKEFFDSYPIVVDTNKFIRAHENIFNQSLIQGITSIVPARSSLSSINNNTGVIIKPTILEKQKYEREENSIETNPNYITGSIQFIKNTDYKQQSLTSSYEQPKTASIASSSITPELTGSDIIFPYSASMNSSSITPKMSGSQLVVPYTGSLESSSMLPMTTGSKLIFPYSGSDIDYASDRNKSFVNIHSSWGKGHITSSDTHFINYVGGTGSYGSWDYNTRHVEPRYHFYLIGDVETYSGSFSGSHNHSSKFEDIHRFNNRQMISSDIHKNITYESLIDGAVGNQTGRAIGKTRFFLTGSDGSITFPRNHISKFNNPFTDTMYAGSQNTNPGFLNLLEHVDYATSSFYSIIVRDGEEQAYVGNKVPSIGPNNQIIQ